MDDRPPVWVGHLVVTAPDVAAASAFWKALGMRLVAQQEDFAVLELRGGTHLVVVATTTADPGEIPFDVMVDDLEGAHKRFQDGGLDPTPIRPGDIHSSFTITDPAGRPVTVNSSHVVGPV
jgi:catechol 2,3-dioxygenase-like lactoylglutathione lyase family enzyme